MVRIIWIFHFLVLIILTIESRSEGIWNESFTVPNKGFWGDTNGTSIHSDLSDITKWELDIAACQLTAEGDYVKTTSTSGGRFEAVDCDGEAIWTSELINISNFKNISLNLNVSETGSGSNTSTKYIRVFYQIDTLPETIFETNGENGGNFGSNRAEQTGLNGENLRIIIRMNSSYASDKLIIDEISVEGEPKIAYSNNHISEINIIDNTRLEVLFSSEINPASVSLQNIQLIQKSDSPVPVLHVSASEQTADKIEICAAKPSETNLILIVSGILDREGLPMRPDTVAFEWIIPCTAQSLIINEIMADPYPSVSLPEYEYIELYNRSDAAIYLNQLRLKIDEKLYQLPDFIVSPASFCLLTSAEGAEFFANALAVKQFPALKNSGTEISVVTNQGLLIDQVYYSDEWYGNEQFMDGGRSLERIDPERFCGAENNWIASTNPAGGTPGAVNSVKRKNLDQLPAKITFLEVVSANQLDVYFSESVDPKCISTPGNYRLKELDIHPDSLIVVDSKHVCLFFGQNFPPKSICRLEMSELIDLCENQAINKSESFIFYEPEEHALVITEIFADPYPANGLPEYEYIEIFNRTSYPISLNRIQLKVETKIFGLGENTILPQEYLVLTSTEGASLLHNGRSIRSFPALRNNAGSIQLLFNETILIDSVEYTDDWYRDPEKREGGWSLERIDNNRFCGAPGNWIASIAAAGGTPGIENSVATENQDSEKPEVNSVDILSANQLKLVFSEVVTSLSLQNTENYSINPDVGNPFQIEMNSETEVLLRFSKNFAANTSYSLHVSGLSDECGNTMDDSEYTFELQQLAAGDVLISEVLFNPYPGGSDFVEIYNHSEKTIDLKSLRLATRDDQSELKEIRILSDEKRLFLPGEYVLCTSDSLSVCSLYYTSCPECFCQMPKFPSYPDDRGTVVLLNDSLQVLDEFLYSEKMHHPLIDDCEGISLERLSFESPASNAANWHSAASTVGFATPGYANSQHNNELLTKETIVLSPEIFSPNNDGYNDRLLIHFQLEKPGYSANVKIYDSLGRLVNHLVKNEILAQEGEWFWDGNKQDNTRLGLGIYIVLIELFDTNGDVKKYRKTCTLTDRL